VPARKGPKKVNRYSIEMKRTAVRLSNAPGARVMDVAEALDITYLLFMYRATYRGHEYLAVDHCGNSGKMPMASDVLSKVRDFNMSNGVSKVMKRGGRLFR
jgi:hypothetical protein